MKSILFTKKKIDNSKEFFNKYKKLFYFIGIIIILLLVFIFFIKSNSNDEGDNLNNNFVATSSILACDGNCTLRLIDGVPVKLGQENPFLIAAIIDNNSLARPQFSLSKASLIYDVPAEGGIDRYLAFFTSNLEEKDLEIGPIRSVRPYFLTIVNEYQALLLHCGGSPEALVKITKDNLLTLNEFYNSSYYRRYLSYQAPHNVLAKYDKIIEYLKDNNLSVSNFTPWKFKTKDLNLINESNLNKKIDIKNGQYQYDVTWEYDQANNVYLKNIASSPQTDNTGTRISADNIIFQFVDTKILDEALRLSIDLVGSGEAIICLDGLCKSGYFEKTDTNARTVFYYDNDEEVVLNSGKTWVHLIDNQTSVEIENFSL
ncbi:MAG TPA: DUF3048 domain-containing protein [bacterium]|nr:DUF3048 domain-containing protein [bacterium]